jgi:hypothetical protein
MYFKSEDTEVKMTEKSESTEALIAECVCPSDEVDWDNLGKDCKRFVPYAPLNLTSEN